MNDWGFKPLLSFRGGRKKKATVCAKLVADSVGSSPGHSHVNHSSNHSVAGWYLTLCLRQKAILHHLICSSHANKKGRGWGGWGGWIGRTRLLLLLTTLPTHGALSDYGKRITTTPLCLLVSLMGEAGEHHSPPVIGPVQVLMPLRGCVSFTISPCQPTYTYSLRRSVLSKLS